MTAVILSDHNNVISRSMSRCVATVVALVIVGSVSELTDY